MIISAEVGEAWSASAGRLVLTGKEAMRLKTASADAGALSAMANELAVASRIDVRIMMGPLLIPGIAGPSMLRLCDSPVTRVCVINSGRLMVSSGSRNV